MLLDQPSSAVAAAASGGQAAFRRSDHVVDRLPGQEVQRHPADGRQVGDAVDEVQADIERVHPGVRALSDDVDLGVARHGPQLVHRLRLAGVDHQYMRGRAPLVLFGRPDLRYRLIAAPSARGRGTTGRRR
ncbi:hypothetical protein ACIP23_07150, partial [Streptomyces sp. NPDC089733]|uniref:hypothetical protein n=1 Tax=Streptomyces sp. NPDC089733 TaxID=3365918 RepID=UPI00382ADF2C